MPRFKINFEQRITIRNTIEVISTAYHVQNPIKLIRDKKLLFIHRLLIDVNFVAQNYEFFADLAVHPGPRSSDRRFDQLSAWKIGYFTAVVV